MSPKHNQLLQSNASSSSMHSMNESIHSSNSTSTSRNNQSHSNSSESVIYRPGASDSGSDFYHSSAASNATAISSAASSNGHSKFNTIPTKINGNVATTIYEEDKYNQQQQQLQLKQQGSPMVPLRSIMRSYNNHVTLPTRGTRGGSAGQLYYEEGHQGYSSDGDALRKNAPAIRYTDIENGYLSEGGVTNPHFMSIFRNRPQLPTTIEERLVKWSYYRKKIFLFAC